MNKLSIALCAIFAVSALERNMVLCLGMALAIYALYARKALMGRSKIKREDMGIIIENFTEAYSKSKNAIKSLDGVSGLFGVNKAHVSTAARAAKLGASRLLEDGAGAIDSQVADFLGIVANGITLGNDISMEVDILHSKVKSLKKLENMVKEKTEGMHVVSQMGIAFFFPMFAGISSSIMSTAMGTDPAGSMVGTFTFSIMLYIGIILFITASFKSPRESVESRIGSVVPLFVTGVVVFLLASSFSNIF